MILNLRLLLFSVCNVVVDLFANDSWWLVLTHIDAKWISVRALRCMFVFSLNLQTIPKIKFIIDELIIFYLITSLQHFVFLNNHHKVFQFLLRV